MNDLRDRQSGKLASIGWLSIAVLLVATMLQSAHICSSPAFGLEGAAEVNATASGAGPCLICLMAQPATAVFLLAVFWLFLAKSPLPKPVEQSLLSLWQGFRLSVRPPPAR